MFIGNLFYFIILGFVTGAIFTTDHITILSEYGTRGNADYKSTAIIQPSKRTIYIIGVL